MATVLDYPIKYSPHTKETALGFLTAASLCCDCVTTLWSMNSVNLPTQ